MLVGFERFLDPERPGINPVGATCRTMGMNASPDMTEPSRQVNIAGASRRAKRGCDEVAKFGLNRQ